jgi:hypothetical protein
MPKDCLGVGAHDEINIVGAKAKRLKGFGDLAGTVDRQIQPALSAVFVREVLDRLTHRGRVHHRHQLGQMLRQQFEIQDLVVQLIE